MAVIMGVTNPDKIIGIDITNIDSMIGVTLESSGGGVVGPV
jgi:hypothetical protein